MKQVGDIPVVSLTCPLQVGNELQLPRLRGSYGERCLMDSGHIT